MFGYVKYDLPNLYVKDTILYKAMYCGLCKSLGCHCGQKARLCLNYDLSFLSVLLHNYLDIDVKIEKQRCIIHWFRRRPVAVVDQLSKRVADVNVILAYHKLTDDIIDSNHGRVKRSLFSKAYKKAKKRESEIDNIVKNWYKRLLCYEKSNGDSIDISADFFGNMMKDIIVEICQEKTSEQLENLAYQLGKWIYLIDAIDDYDKDIKKKSYNVFVNLYSECKNKKQVLENHKEEIEFCFANVLSNIFELNKQIKYNFNHDLIDNILFLGLREQTKKILEKK